MSIEFISLGETSATLIARLPMARGQGRSIAIAPGTGEVFAQLPRARLFNELTVGALHARLPGMAVFAAQNGDAKVFARLPLPQGSGTTISLAPSYFAVATTGLPLLQMSAYALQPTVGELNARLPSASGLLSQVEAQGKVLAKLPTARALGRDTLPAVENWVLLAQEPGVLWSFGAVAVLSLADTVSASDAATITAWPTIHDGVTASDAAGAGILGLVSAATSVDARDSLLIAWELLASSAGEAADVPSILRTTTMEALSELVATGAASSITTAMLDLAEAALVDDLARMGYDLDAASEADAADLVFGRLSLIVDAISAAVADAAATAGIRFVVLAGSEAGATDAASAGLTYLLDAISSGSAFVTLTLGDGEIITAWALNPEINAFVEYQNYPFNSYAELDGEYFGGSETGLYVLDGDDDDGDDIDSWVITAINSLGSTKYKRIESAYIGVRTDGSIALGITSTSDNKTVVKDYYEIRSHGGDTISENSFKPGMGIKSVYMAFELRNIDGADMEIDFVKVIPIVIDRSF